eukprot:CCRYP_012656-RA/>CCRYP_012656-RA protein AED:0.44 eAED:0.94 QI:0/0/0.33/1/0/0/3/50/164
MPKLLLCGVGIEKLQILVAIMHPHRIRAPTRNRHAYQAPVPHKRMSLIHQRINNCIHHPPIQDYLRHIVNDHGFSQEDLHIVPRGQEPIRHELQGGQTDEVKERECERHSVGVHGGGERGGGIAGRVREIGPEGEEANEDGGGGVAGYERRGLGGGGHGVRMKW